MRFKFCSLQNFTYLCTEFQNEFPYGNSEHKFKQWRYETRTISGSMGHSGSSYITSNYIGAYPLVKMLEYNHYLLNEKQRAITLDENKSALLEALKELSEEDRKALLQ